MICKAGIKEGAVTEPGWGPLPQETGRQERPPLSPLLSLQGPLLYTKEEPASSERGSSKVQQLNVLLSLQANSKVR